MPPHARFTTFTLWLKYARTYVHCTRASTLLCTPTKHHFRARPVYDAATQTLSVVDLLDTCVLWPSRAASMEPSKQTSNTVRLSSGSSTETLPSTSDALAVFTRPEAEAVDPTSCPRWTDLGQEAGSYAGWLTRFRGLWQLGHRFQRPGLGRQGVQRSH